LKSRKEEEQIGRNIIKKNLEERDIGRIIRHDVPHYKRPERRRRVALSGKKTKEHQHQKSKDGKGKR